MVPHAQIYSSGKCTKFVAFSLFERVGGRALKSNSKELDIFSELYSKTRKQYICTQQKLNYVISANNKNILEIHSVEMPKVRVKRRKTRRKLNFGKLLIVYYWFDQAAFARVSFTCDCNEYWKVSFPNSN